MNTQNILKMQKFHGPFRLTVTIISALLDKSSDILGKMDPYPVIEHGKDTQALRKIKGPVHKGGHKSPKWDWKVELMLCGEALNRDISKDVLMLSVYEEDLTSDEYIGDTGILDLHDLVMLGSSQRQARSKKDLPLTQAGDRVGKLSVEIVLEDLSLKEAIFIPGILRMNFLSAQLIQETFSKPKPMIATVSLGGIIIKGNEGGDSLCLPVKNENLPVSVSLSEDNGKREGKLIGKTDLALGILIGSTDETVTVLVYDLKGLCTASIKFAFKYEQEPKIAIKPFVVSQVESKAKAPMKRTIKGQLELIVEGADLSRDNQSESQPFVVMTFTNLEVPKQSAIISNANFILPPQSIRTKLCQDSGQQPIWKECFKIGVSLKEVSLPTGVTFFIYDEDKKNCNLVGESSMIDISELCQNKVHNFLLNYKFLSAGTLKIRTNFRAEITTKLANAMLQRVEEKKRPALAEPESDKEPEKPKTVQVASLKVAAISKPVQEIPPEAKISQRGPSLETTRKLKKSPLPTLKLKKRHKSVNRALPQDWNGRFFVDGVTNYTEAHPYFKQYFDKPTKKTPYTRYRQTNLEAVKQATLQQTSPRQVSNSPIRVNINTNSENVLYQDEKPKVKKHASIMSFKVRDPSIKELQELRKGGSQTEMKFYMPSISELKPLVDVQESARYKIKKSVRGMSKASDHHTEHADYLYGKYFKNFDSTLPQSSIIHGGASTIGFPYSRLQAQQKYSTTLMRPSMATLPNLKQNIKQMKEVYGQERQSPSMNAYLFSGKKHGSPRLEGKQKRRQSSLESDPELQKALAQKYSKWVFE